MSKAYYTQVS